MTETSSRVEESRREDADERTEAPNDLHGRVEVYPGCDVVVEFDPETTFECVDGCSWCCHHGVLLYEDDYLELANRADLSRSTVDFRGSDFVRREEKDRTDHVADDGMACYFLTDEGRCGLQVERSWKPTRCSVFPLAIERKNGSLHVDIRDSAQVHCEGLGVSERRLVDHLDAFLPEVLWELDDPDTAVEL